MVKIQVDGREFVGSVSWSPASGVALSMICSNGDACDGTVKEAAGTVDCFTDTSNSEVWDALKWIRHSMRTKGYSVGSVRLKICSECRARIVEGQPGETKPCSCGHAVVF
jgi:hypothetical protein